MNSEPSPEDIALWQRRFASAANNSAWALAEMAKRTPAQDDEMLQAAHAAMHLWRSIGTPRNHAHAAQLLAHVNALLGVPDPAQSYFAQARDFFVAEQSEPWELALVYAVGANVAYCAGNAIEHLESYAKAEEAIRSLADLEDQEIVYATLRVVPKPKPHGG